MEREAFDYKGIKFTLSFIVANGKPASRLNYQWRGKYVRKTFQHDTTGSEARKFAKKFVDSKNIGFDGLEDLSPEVIADIKEALAILPAGQSLTSIVRRAVEYASDINIYALAKEYIELKISTEKSKDHIIHVRGALNKLCDTLPKFELCTPDAICKLLNNGDAPKTRMNKAIILSSFFGYAKRKNAIKNNPFDKINKDDFGGKDSENIPEVATIQQSIELIAYINQYRPKYLKHFILALFAGIRIEECGRITPDLIDVERKEILFPKKIVKGKIKAFILGDYEPVLFDWLKDLKNNQVYRPNQRLRCNIGKVIGLPANFARHSFATYHLSLYRDFARTAKLTRHLSVETLENNYVGSMVTKDVAKRFFGITPTFIEQWSAENQSRLAEIAEQIRARLAEEERIRRQRAKQKKTL